ncbi:PhzF family phenazine biosynthesis protein [Chitinophaga lutea]|uniref:PhzF family phenazine biosynthesis protein n=1 Tax=Chitinophaga lutea TaxID=2488634 RepID=A0A3N4PMZ1_9BACT|nr:PhzF family phenazine biosynthesis protein [Chitinophaga lutea]RPE09536.1 PhzF family phenazine biosynthesis protein [Chitinophaga lutea]
MKTMQYYVLDVFTSERFKGNPLPVVITGKELETTLYQQIAREFGYAGTSFIHYSKSEKALRVRSFAPSGTETGGAGHNLLGAVCLAVLKDMNVFRIQENGPFVIMKDKRIRLSVENSGNDSPSIGMLQKPATAGNTVPAADMAAALNLQADDLLLHEWQPTVIQTEVAHLMVPLKNMEALNRAIPVQSALQNLATGYGFKGCYCFTLTDKDTPQLAQARFFNPAGPAEEAATGSAAGPLGGFLFQKGYIHQNRDYSLLQGVKMGQPSILRFRTAQEGIWVSGSSVIVMEGILHL